MNIEQEIISEIQKAKHIVITAHKSADGDSIGSSVALYHLCKNMSTADVQICHPDEKPKYLAFLPGSEEIIDFENQAEKAQQLLNQADLLFSLDYNNSSRLGADMQAAFDAAPGTKIMIDHHLFPADYAKYTISQPEVNSTCQLIYELIEAGQVKQYLDSKIANAIYLGMMTDSGSFRFQSVTYRTHEVLAELLKIGIKQHLIHEAVYDTNTIDRLRLKGYAQSSKLELIENDQVAFITITCEEMERFNYQKGDTEGLVNIALSVDGIKIACLFTEAENYVKLSIRSKADFPINLLASNFFQGGGHANASGGKYDGTIDEAVTVFKNNVSAYL